MSFPLRRGSEVVLVSTSPSFTNVLTSIRSNSLKKIILAIIIIIINPSTCECMEDPAVKVYAFYSTHPT